MKVEDEKLKELLRNEGIYPRVVWIKSEPHEQAIELVVEEGALYARSRGKERIWRKDTVNYTKAHYPELWI